MSTSGGSCHLPATSAGSRGRRLWAPPGRETRRFLLRVGFGLGLYALVARAYFIVFYHGFNVVFPRFDELGRELTSLDFSFLVSLPYSSPFMLGASVLHPVFGPALFLAAVVPFLAYRDLAWSSFRSSKLLRNWITWLAAVLAWAFSTYDYNLYVDEAHYIDRILLIVLAGLVWRHPAFLSLFLSHCLLMMSQFLHPLGWLSVTDKSLLFSILLVFQTVVYLRAAGALERKLARASSARPAPWRRWLARVAEPLRGLNTGFFFYLALCSIGVHYFAPAVTKIAISPHGFEWMLDDEFAADTVFTFERGWLSWLPDETLGRIVSLIAAVDSWLLVGTMLLELAALFIVFRRSVTLSLLALFVCFHSTIMAVAGVFFWKWILLDIALIPVLLWLDKVSLKEIYGRRAVLSSLLLITCGFIVFQPTRLGWFDTRYHTASRLEVVGESGQRYVLNKSFMDPYEMFFTFDKYHFLDHKRTLFVGSWNVDYEQSVRIRQAGIEGIEELVLAEGRVPYDAEKSEDLFEFLRLFFSRLNQRGSKEVFLSYLAAPHHIFMYERGGVYDLQEPIESIWITFYEQYWDGERIYPLQESRVGPIRIPKSTTPPGEGTSFTADN